MKNIIDKDDAGGRGDGALDTHVIIIDDTKTIRDNTMEPQRNDRACSGNGNR